MSKNQIKEVESVCTYCGVGCDITAVVKDNKIQRIYAQKDGVVSQGKLCIKGKYGYDFVDAEDRVKEPRVRKSFLDKNPHILKQVSDKLEPFDEIF
jgi:formate dehydrogenase major subunit